MPVPGTMPRRRRGHARPDSLPRRASSAPSVRPRLRTTGEHCTSQDDGRGAGLTQLQPVTGHDQRAERRPSPTGQERGHREPRTLCTMPEPDPRPTGSRPAAPRGDDLPLRLLGGAAPDRAELLRGVGARRRSRGPADPLPAHADGVLAAAGRDRATRWRRSASSSTSTWPPTGWRATSPLPTRWASSPRPRALPERLGREVGHSHPSGREETGKREPVRLRLPGWSWPSRLVA